MTSCPSASPPAIRREIALSDLRPLSEAEAEQAVEEGLEGNQEYADLRGLNVGDLQAVLIEEERWLARMREAANPAEVEGRLLDLRGSEFEPANELWGLDLGVASAVVALASLGACPVSSCNGGAFGLGHQAGYAYVSFFIYEASLQRVLGFAEEVGCGLVAIDGLGHLFGPVESLMGFARQVMSASL